VQRVGCDALWKLASNPANRQSLLSPSLDGERAVKSALRAHPRVAAVQSRGRAALRLLCPPKNGEGGGAGGASPSQQCSECEIVWAADAPRWSLRQGF
jgi:hypothetical protein